MRRSRFSDEQIIGILKEHRAGLSASELCRKYGVSDATFYKWRSKYGGMEVSEVKRLKELEAENRKLKQLIGEKELDITDPPDVSAATIARFAPDSAEPWNSVSPAPTDLIKDPETGLLSSARVRVGWQSAGADAETPDMLRVTSDQPNYAPGTSARIHLQAPFAGRAELVLGEGLPLPAPNSGRGSDATSSGSTLTATSRWRVVSRARKTSPIPPAPRRAMISSHGTCGGCSCTGGRTTGTSASARARRR